MCVCVCGGGAWGEEPYLNVTQVSGACVCGGGAWGREPYLNVTQVSGACVCVWWGSLGEGAHARMGDVQGGGACIKGGKRPLMEA